MTVLLSFATAFLVACMPDAGCPDRWCGTAVVATAAEADVLLPVATTQDVGYAIGDLIFLKLADVGPEMNTVDPETFEPRLASSWEFEDERTIVFTLDPNAKWHDGVPVTAEDVVFTFDVYRDPVVASASRPRVLEIESVAARGDGAVEFRFDHAYPEMLFDAVYHMRILPSHLLDTVPHADISSSPLGRNPVGNGPYRFVRWDAGQSIELVADPDFHLGRPGIRRIIWRFVGDPNTAVAQMLAGEVDLLQTLSPEAQEQVEARDDLRAVMWTPPIYYLFVQFNMLDADGTSRPHPLFRERAVREAIAMAVDREAVVNAVFPQGVVGRGPMAPVQWVWHGEYEQIPFDTAAARARLAEQGWSDSDGDGLLDRDGQPFSFNLLLPSSSVSRRRAGEIMQAQLRRIGVELTITAIEFNAFRERAAAHRFDTYFGGYGGDPSPTTIAEVWETGAPANHGSYSSAEVDRLIGEARAATDLAAVRAAWYGVVTLINDDVPAIWMYTGSPIAGVSTRFENVSIRSDNFAATLWQWRVPASRLIDRDRITDAQN
jgi:peptide/nickel transport system substrate-binding protein